MRTVPIEDVSILILEHPQITITHGVMAKLLERNVALISCNSQYHPTGMMLNLCGNSTQAESFSAQNNASVPLKKHLWKQTVQAKIRNQAALLEQLGVEAEVLHRATRDVKSGDSNNRESVAAVYYWPRVFNRYPGFMRGREAGYPNNLLNYGYAILRSVMARSLVGSGLHPTIGIFHHNRYNHYCLADDMMEPYRPVVDRLVANIVERIESAPEVLEKEHRVELLSIPTLDVMMNGKKRPLMIATSETSASLARCFSGNERKVVLPELTRNE